MTTTPPLPTGPLPAAPQTSPLVAVTPTWRTPTGETQAITPPPRGAHAAPDTNGEGLEIFSGNEEAATPTQPKIATTPLVLIFAMFFLTLCCLIISMAGGPGPAAIVVGVGVVCGAVLSYIFKDRWH